MKIEGDSLETYVKIASIYKSIKEPIHYLEAKTINMADCLINLVKIAIAIKTIPNSNPFQVSAIQIYNHQYILYNLILIFIYLHIFFILNIEDSDFTLILLELFVKLQLAYISIFTMMKRPANYLFQN